MSIETEINRISTNVSNTLSAVSEMGGEVPEGATSDDMASGVRSIPVGAKIDDTTPSTSTTYSSSKIESELTALNDANAALIEVSKTEPNTGNTELWIHPNAEEVHLPQINDSVESEQDTWSSKKIAAEVSKKANDVDLAAVAKSGSYNDLTNKPTIPTVPSTLPNPNALTFTGAVNETYDGSTAKSVAIPTVPESLKNPNKLILTGAVTAEYDGSAEVSVEIPAGGGYNLPVASPTTLGGVKPVAKTAEMTQAVGVDDAGGLWALPGGGDDTAELLAEVTLEEEVNKVVLNLPGECYKRLYILAATKATANSGTDNAATRISINNQNSYDANAFSAAGLANSNTEYGGMFRGVVLLEDSFCMGFAYHSRKKFGSSTGYTQDNGNIDNFYNPNISRNTPINFISMMVVNNGTGLFGIGSVLKVWGVKA